LFHPRPSSQRERGEQDCPALHRSFAEQHAGHQWELGEVAGKKPLVAGECLDADDPRVAAFEDFIDQQERVAVRDGGKDFFAGHGIHCDTASGLLVSNQQSAISNQQSAISNQQSAISNQQSAISNQQSAISNQQSAVSSQHSAFINSEIHPRRWRRSRRN
jgi:hypothetical protein